MRHHGQGHQRGLSIFEDMSTVNAIISSGHAENRHATTSGTSSSSSSSGRQDVRPVPVAGAAAYHHPQGSSSYPSRVHPLSTTAPSAILASSFSAPNHHNDACSATNTPTAQVSFPRRHHRLPAPSSFDAPGDGVGGPPPPAPGGNLGDPPPCMGNSSCVCNSCHSPTLAIFDQMSLASQKLENGEVDLAKYAGLSPPHLSTHRTTMATINEDQPDRGGDDGRGSERAIVGRLRRLSQGLLASYFFWK